MNEWREIDYAQLKDVFQKFTLEILEESSVLPPVDTTVLLVDADKEIYYGFLDSDVAEYEDIFFNREDNGEPCYPVAWLEIPEPPEYLFGAA